MVILNTTLSKHIYKLIKHIYLQYFTFESKYDFRNLILRIFSRKNSKHLSPDKEAFRHRTDGT